MPTPTFANLPEDKRARIAHAALVEFASRSYREASLDRVAKHARIAKGSLYQYFADKADLYHFLVFGELGRRKQEALRDAVWDDSLSLPGRLRAMCLAGLSLFRKDALAASLAARLYEHETDPEVRRIHHDAREGGVAYMRVELSRAHACGELRDGIDIDAAARLLSHLVGPALVDLLVSKLGGSLDRLATSRDPIDEAVIVSAVDAVIDIAASGLFVKETVS